MASDGELLEVLRLAKLGGLPATAADVANRLAWRWIRESRFPEIPGLVDGLPESHVTGSLWRAVGWAHRVLGEGDRALAALTRALTAAAGSGDSWAHATTLTSIGAVYYARGDLDTALTHYRQALPLLQATGDKNGQATTLNNIGLVHWTVPALVEGGAYSAGS